MDLETTNLRRDWWLVKVPNYVGQAFATKECGDCLGKLKITRTARGQEVKFDVDPDIIVAGKRPSEEELPRAHKLTMHAAPKHSLAVLSESMPSQEAIAASRAAHTTLQPDHVSVEGRIVQRADAKPTSYKAYIALKKKQVEIAQTPVRPVQRIDGPVPIKPIAHIVQPDKSQKDNKRVRLPKEEVEEKLFNLFERHQYYSFQDLVRLTEQPPAHLKEILKGIAIYNTKNPHKNMWQLNSFLQRYDEKESTD
ncbi:general transcription factor IIF subunit 2-like [Sycon ciliatum]|uniref:general transcription factor IIF subunit 2-like n=1 Tax=Sycon ciliatum TaxID=27933 RepID=UPI0020AC2C38|eukprot:scpid89401/ scgid31586/ General transcription factor IIF subunit 2; ATP-dependent helicase TfIIF-beta; Transcription initiation factor IIF subunit beta